MSTPAKPSAVESFPAHEDFIKYPLYKVVSVFGKPENTRAAVIELRKHRFPIDDIESYCGKEGEKKFDFDGTRHGVWTKFLRAIQHIGPERTYLERYEKELHDGHCIIMVNVRNKERKETAGRILNNHTSERVTYFGLLAADEIKPT
jgi:hypothetical protein